MSTNTFDKPPVPRNTAIATLAVVMLAAAVAQGYGRFTYGVVLPDVREDLLDGSNTLAGLLGTANTFAYLAGALLVGSLGRLIRPAGWLRIGIVLSSAGILGAALAPNGVVLAISLIVMGVGGASIWIPSPGIATTVVPIRWRGLAVGMMGAGVGVGIVSTGQIANASGDAPDAWRSVYGIEFAIALVALVLVYAVLRHHRGEVSASGGFGGFGVLSSVEGWRPITLCYTVYGFGYLLIVAFLVARLEDDAGWSSGRASAMFTLLGACTLVGGIGAGRLSDWAGRRHTLMVGFLSFSGSALLILTGDTVWVVIGVFGAGLLFSGLPTVITAYIIDRTTPTTYGPSYAAATFSFGMAQVMAPQAGGAIADWRGSFTSVFVLSAVVMATGSVIASRLPHDHPAARRAARATSTDA